jgi:hypothetical protein
MRVGQAQFREDGTRSINTTDSFESSMFMGLPNAKELACRLVEVSINHHEVLI